jgi:hypothetical protein
MTSRRSFSLKLFILGAALASLLTLPTLAFAAGRGFGGGGFGGGERIMPGGGGMRGGPGMERGGGEVRIAPSAPITVPRASGFGGIERSMPQLGSPRGFGGFNMPAPRYSPPVTMVEPRQMPLLHQGWGDGMVIRSGGNDNLSRMSPRMLPDLSNRPASRFGLPERNNDLHVVAPDLGHVPWTNHAAGANADLRLAPILHSPGRDYRGPGSGDTLRVLDPAARQQSQMNLRNWVRQHNNETASGNLEKTIPIKGTWINRDKAQGIGANYDRIRSSLGDPHNAFGFRHHREGDFGHFGLRHRFDGDDDDDDFVVLNCFFPYYLGDPYATGFYSNYYPSVYDYWGWSPDYINPNRVYYDQAALMYDNPGLYGTTTAYDIDTDGADQAIADIRQAWLDGNINAFGAHLDDQLDINIYFDGDYSYSTSSSDYYSMTADAMATTKTISLDFDRPAPIGNDEISVRGKQVFTGPENDRHTLYVSYQLRLVGNDWYIVSFDSSPNSLYSNSNAAY